MGLGCSCQLSNDESRRRKATKFFGELDERLAANLQDESIKLVDAAFLRTTDLTHISRRQDLAGLERATRGMRVFVPPKEAVKMLANAQRIIAVLTYGWNTPDDPDPTGQYLAAVKRFLHSSEGAHIKAIFWDFPSLPQKPRSADDNEKFAAALECMGDLYASPLGTTVIRHRTIPKRPAELDGVIAIAVAPPPTISVPFHEYKLHLKKDQSDAQCDLCDSDASMYTCGETDFDLCKDCAKPFLDHIRDYEANLRDDLLAVGVTSGDIIHLTPEDESRRWMLRVSSHELAETAVARLTARMDESSLPDGSYCFCFFNDRPYFTEGVTNGRGWTTFESGVGGEAVCRLESWPLLKGVLDSLPPKLIEIDGPAPLVAHLDASQGALERSAAIRADIAAANFTGSGDKPKVIELYHDYVVDITNAINEADTGFQKSSCLGKLAGMNKDRSWAAQQQEPVYEGDLDLTRKDGKQRHGFGKLRFLDGSSYEGQFVHGDYHGHGIYRHATGDVYEGEYRDDEENGFGVYTQPSGFMYVGNWLDGNEHGEGTAKEPNGDIYTGGWKADGRSGHGKQWYANGDFYDGQWKDGLFHGVGYLVDRRDETACVSRWKDDTPISPGVAWASESGSFWDSAHVVKFLDKVDSYETKVERKISLEEARKLVEKMGAAVPPFPVVPPPPEVCRPRFAEPAVKLTGEKEVAPTEVSVRA